MEKEWIKIERKLAVFLESNKEFWDPVLAYTEIWESHSISLSRK